jgi:hypothetical protein
MQDQAEKLKSGGGQYNTFIFPKPGTYRHRHVNVGKDNDIAIEATCYFLSKDLGMVVSPKTFGGKCALTEAYEELKNSSKTKDQELAKKLKPKKRFLSLSYRYKDEKGKEVDTENGVKITMLMPDQYQNMIDMYLDEECGDFTDNKTGYDILHKRVGTGQFDTTYSSVHRSPTKVHPDYKGPYNLEEAVKALIPTYKATVELRDKFFNIPAEEEDDDQPKKKSSKGDMPKKKKKSSKGDI